MLGVHPLFGHNGGPSLNVADVFSTDLYTGNGGTKQITNGLDFYGSGGLVWIKSRSTSNSHYLFDSARGWNRALSSNLSDAESAGWNSFFGVFNAGFGVGNQSNINGLSAAYASWSFRRAARFFDVVAYTGDGVSGRAIPHNLGVASGIIIVKRLDSDGGWAVFHRSLGVYSASVGATINLNLNSSAAASSSGYFRTVGTDAMNFAVSADPAVNAVGATYIAYLFAHDAASDGIVQCGSFTTTSSGDATINLGWRPQFILWKDYAVSGTQWEIQDEARGYGSGSNPMLAPSISNAEYTGPASSPLSNGFLAKGGWMGQNRSYIYMAIRAEGV